MNPCVSMEYSKRVEGKGWRKKMREVSERDIRYSRKVTREEENFLDERIFKKKIPYIL